MLDYINKYQAGGQIDVDKLRDGLKDDEHFYKKGNFTSAGKKRLAAIQEIDINQKNGVEYKVDPESNTFRTVDSSTGKEVSVDTGQGRDVDANSPFYGTLSKEKRTRNEISNTIGDALSMNLFKGPKLEPNVTKDETINLDDVEDPKPEEKTKLEPSSKKEYKDYVSPDFSGFLDPSILFRGDKTADGSGGAGAGSGNELDGDGKVDGKETKVVKLSNQTFLDNMEKEIGYHMKSNWDGDFSEDPDTPDFLVNEGINNLAELNKGVEYSDELIKGLRDGRPNHTNMTELQIMEHNKLMHESMNKLIHKRLNAKVEETLYFLTKKREEAMNSWSFQGSDGLDAADEKAATIAAIDNQISIYQQRYKDIKDPAKTYSYNDLKKEFDIQKRGEGEESGKWSKHSYQYDLADQVKPTNHRYDAPVYTNKTINPLEYSTNGEAVRRKTFDKAISTILFPLSPNTSVPGSSTVISAASYLFRKGGKLEMKVTKHQNGDTVYSDDFLERFNSIVKKPLFTFNKDLKISDVASMTTQDYADKLARESNLSLANPKGYNLDADYTGEDKSGVYQIGGTKPKLPTDPTDPNTPLLGRTGVNTPVGQLQYNDIGQFVLATIARNQKIDEIKPFYEQFKDTGSMDVLAARDIDNASLAERQRVIAGTRNPYNGSDPVMRMISGNMAESAKTQMESQLAAERGNYRRSEEDRVATQTEQKRLQQAANFAEANAVANRNGERAMQYDSAKAQSEQQRKSEYFANLSALMGDIQGRGNVQAAKERDLDMTQSALEYESDLAAKNKLIERQAIFTSQGQVDQANSLQESIDKYTTKIDNAKKLTPSEEYRRNIKSQGLLPR